MKKLLSLFLLLPALAASSCYAGFWDDVKKELNTVTRKQGLSEDTVVAGLKEALSVGTGKAVDRVSRVDGYFRNPDITIPFPPKIRKAADTLRKVGLHREVDEFVLSMNRAAEKAAPRAADIFVDAVKQMSFADARRILKGHDTAATEYFRDRTTGSLHLAFRPIVSSAMDSVGVTRSFKKLMEKYNSLPFVKDEPLDLDSYVTDEALEGLFLMVGREEQKIRKDPAARVTELLKEVFGN